MVKGGDPTTDNYVVSGGGFDEVTHSLRADGFDAPEDGTGRGTPLVFDTTQVTSPSNYSEPKKGAPCHPLASGQHPPAIAFGWNKSAAQTMAVGETSDALQSSPTSNPAVCFSAKDSGADAAEELAPTLRSGGHNASHANAGVMPAVCFEARVARNGRGAPSELTPPLKAESGQTGKGDAAPLVAGGQMRVRRLTPRECERLQSFPDDWTLIEYRGKLASDGPRYKALGNAVTVSVAEWIAKRICGAAY